MPRFEVFCRAAPPVLMADVMLRVEAEHWLAALKAGLNQVPGPQLARNVLCDIQSDGSIHVTDPIGGGVFRIQELRADEAPAQHSSRTVTGPPAPSSGPGRVALLARPSAPLPGQIGRIASTRPAEVVLETLFERVAEISGHRDRNSALGFLLDLAMEKVDAEAGSVFFVPLGGNTLCFALARGPRAKELLELGTSIPMGVGIVGFCAQENVCLAVCDAEKDPRFYRAICEAIGYETRSLICAPIARNGQVLGALELMNKGGGARFEQRDLAVVSFVAHRAAEVLATIAS